MAKIPPQESKRKRAKRTRQAKKPPATGMQQDQGYWWADRGKESKVKSKTAGKPPTPQRVAPGYWWADTGDESEPKGSVGGRKKPGKKPKAKVEVKAKPKDKQEKPKSKPEVKAEESTPKGSIGASKKPKGKTKSVPKGVSVAAITEKYLGANFPSSPAMVKKFFSDLKLPGSAELSNRLAGQIADKLHAIPAANAKEALGKIGAGLTKTIKHGGEGNAAATIARFFGLDDSSLGSIKSKVGRAARGVWEGSKTTGGALGAVGLALGLRKIREGVDTSRELGILEATQPSAEDLFETNLLNELQFRSRMNTIGGGRGSISAGAIESLLGSDGSENVMGSMSIPPSSGFPIG